jgi:hypothetical protein
VYCENILENSGYTNVLPAPNKVLSCAEADKAMQDAANATNANLKLLITLMMIVCFYLIN